MCYLENVKNQTFRFPLSAKTIKSYFNPKAVFFREWTVCGKKVINHRFTIYCELFKTH